MQLLGRRRRRCIAIERDVTPDRHVRKQKAPPDFSGGAFFELCWRVLSPCVDAHKGLTSVLGRPGSVLLSRGLSRSTMDAEGFDGRVRNGIG